MTQQQTKIGVLLINLGTPDAPTTTAVRRYLREFLSDPRVIDIPALLRWILLNAVILPFRPRRSASAYQQIWSKQGSPLLIYSQALADQLAVELGVEYEVVLGMRYGAPSIPHAIDHLLAQQCSRLMILPLFPQYSSAATGSAIESALTDLAKRSAVPEIQVLNSFFADSAFIECYAQHIKQHVNIDSLDKMIFSYHGLPERQVNRVCHDKDCHRHSACPIMNAKNHYCYRAHCYATSRALVSALEIDPDSAVTAFQSRLGKTPWIKPYTDLILPELAQSGAKNIAIVTPAFVADCLETLEEVGIRLREQWHELGGQGFSLVPCLNASPKWVKVLSDMITNVK